LPSPWSPEFIEAREIALKLDMAKIEIGEQGSGRHTGGSHTISRPHSAAWQHNRRPILGWFSVQTMMTSGTFKTQLKSRGVPSVGWQLG
jgi:hypothetical protein